MSLAELRNSPRVGLPERTYELCLAPALVGEVQALVSELEDAEIAAAVQRDGGGATAPRRMGEASRSQEIRTRLGELSAEMAEHTGTLTLRGFIEGRWREWVDQHPAREGNKRDSKVTFGCCDADDLVDELESFVVAWNGEPLGAGDWEFIRSNASPGDLKAIAQTVVVMHESAVDVPKLLSGSLGILSAATA